MRDGVQKAILLLVLVNFADEKNGVHDESRDDQPEKDDAEHERHDFPPVENDPGNVQRQSQPHQAGAQRSKNAIFLARLEMRIAGLYLNILNEVYAK